MTLQTSADAIVESLVSNGVDTVFGLPGAQTYALFDALARRSGVIRTIGARHEQGIAYMAFGYARSTGKLGVFAPVPGPGMLNTTAAMCTSLGSCTPTLCVTGDVPTGFFQRGRGHLHELPDQLGILERLTKHAARIVRPADVPAAMNDAIEAACSGRPGPAAVSMCWDTMGEQADIVPLGAATCAPASPPDADAVERCVELIGAASHPMIFTGSGAQHASAEITELAELLQAPVVGFRGGRGIVGEDRPLGLSMAAAWHLWPRTDLMIGIGTRLEIPYIRWGSLAVCHRALPGRKLVRVEVDGVEMGRLETDGPLLGDAAAGTRALVQALESGGHRRRGDPAAIAQAKAKAAVEIRTVQPQMSYLDVIREVLPRDGFLVEELSQVGFTTYFGFPVYRPRTYVSCGFQGTLGFGFPTALGVKVANPDRAVVSISGDGGFMFGMAELATAVQYTIGVVALVFDNASYGNVRRDQTDRFAGRLNGADLVNPDFVRLAESFGVQAWRVDTPAGLRTALQAALAVDGPTLIHIRVPRGSETSPWPLIHPGSSA